MVKRYLVPSEYTADESWRLVDWCRSLGADEFTVDCLSTDAKAAELSWEEFQNAVQSLSAGVATRERMSGRTADDLRRPTELWKLDDSSIGALKKILPEGIFQYDPLGAAWFEDPVIYREGELILGVLSHEAFAVLRVTEAEAAQLAAAGFASHESLPRIS